MAGIMALDVLLSSMKPALMDGEYVFCVVPGKLEDYIGLTPLATFQESEGLTLLLDKSVAESKGLTFDCAFKQITLTVHSSLEAVGLTAAVSTKLAEKGISGNVIAAYYHDHIFVQAEVAQRALAALQEFNEH